MKGSAGTALTGKSWDHMFGWVVREGWPVAILVPVGWFIVAVTACGLDPRCSGGRASGWCSFPMPSTGCAESCTSSSVAVKPWRGGSALPRGVVLRWCFRTAPRILHRGYQFVNIIICRGETLAGWIRVAAGGSAEVVPWGCSPRPLPGVPARGHDHLSR